MEQTGNLIISASRRTDIPSFYMNWFMENLEKGRFDVVNPFNNKVSTVDVNPARVHTIVFWSKNYGPFITGRHADRLQLLGYKLLFNFTLNSEVRILEPNIPPLEERFKQLEVLCARFSPAAVLWRFDPICFFRVAGGPLQDNLGDFTRIADHAAINTINACTTSFMDDYAKIQKRLSRTREVQFYYPSLEEKLEVILHMEKILAERSIKLHTCCEPEILPALPADSKVRGSSCISHDLLMDLFGGSLSRKSDKGQRISRGCGCMEARDIGSYRLHPCYNDCLYCYANPAVPRRHGNHSSACHLR